MAIYRDGKLVGGVGGGGGGGLTTSQVDARIASWARTGEDRPTEIVATLPTVGNAKSDVVYVRASDWTGWVRKSTVTAIASHRVAHPVSGLDLEGVFDSDLTSPNSSDFYFNSATNRFRLWNGSTWANRTITQLFGSNRIGVGIGAGSPAPVEIDTIDEVIDYLVLNGYDDSQTYIFYDSATSYPTAIREITDATLFHEWEEFANPLKGNAYYDYADRTIVALGDRDTAPEITLEHDTGTTYNLHIEQNSDLIHLPDVDKGTSIRLSEDNTLWLGRVESFTKEGDVWIFKANFQTTRGTFTIGESLHIEIGAIPHSRTSFFYGVNQTERIPDDLSDSHDIETGGIKRFAGNADENIHGGIAHTMLNSNDITNADNQVDLSNTAIQIDESGHFHFRVKMFGNQNGDANVRVRVYKIQPGIDDVALLTIGPWFNELPPANMTDDRELVAEYFDEEQYLDITSGDQFIVVMSEYNTGDTGEIILAGYLEIERVD